MFYKDYDIKLDLYKLNYTINRNKNLSKRKKETIFYQISSHSLQKTDKEIGKKEQHTKKIENG